ncbi:hypothetical protein JCM3765_000204 [Sporobolomyces pararoseus]
MRSISSSPYLIALSFRLLNAFASRSFFQPDEYWQSLEVAHLWVFGFGYKTWEWRSQVGSWLSEAGSSSEDWSNLLKDGGKGGIRSPLSVLPSAVVYKILKLAGMGDRGEWLVLAPRLLQAFIAASADVAVRQIAERALGNDYGNAALLVSLTSFFNFFTSTRTFSNSTETALTAWALAWWPWRSYQSPESSLKDIQDENKPRNQETSGSLLVSLSLAAVAVIIRPSNAVIWLILGIRFFLKSSSHQRLSIIATTTLVSLFAIAISLALDTSFYETPTFTPLRFLSTNVFHSISLFYGQNPWHFYLFQGIPLLLLTQLRFLLDGICRFYRSRASAIAIRDKVAVKELGFVAVGTTASYSLLSHKEWRFLHPILPILHLFVTLSLVSSYQNSLAHSSAPARSLARKALHPIERLATRSRIKLSHFFILLFSLVPALYLTAFHQRGQNDAVLWLRDGMRSQRTSSESGSRLSKEKEKESWREIKSVGFAMPCHSTPWQSHLHSKELAESGRAWFITCEPPVLGQPQDIYLDQSDHFYSSPSTYFLTRFPLSVDSTFPPSLISTSPDPYAVVSSHPPTTSTTEARQQLIEKKFDLEWSYSSWPSHLVVFQALLDTPCRPEEPCRDVRELLVDRLGYKVEKKFWNGIGGWHEDERRKGGVVLLSWMGTE